MSRERFPHYVEGISLIQANDRRRFRRLLCASCLSTIEKTLLRARSHFRQNRPELAIRILEPCTPTNDFFAGERHILLAHAWFLRSDFELAAIHNLRALEYFTSACDRRGIFLSLYNLSVDYNRLGALKLSQHFLRRAEELALGPAEESCIHRAKACQFSMEKRFDEACRALERAMHHRDLLKIDERAALHAVAADIYFRAGRLNECRSCLESIFNETSNHTERARVEFELKILAYFQSGKPLPARAGFIERSHEFSLKWQILRSVQGGELERLKRLWDRLCAMFPLLFGKEFSCLVESEQGSIFYTYFKSQLVPKGDLLSGGNLRGRVGKLHALLNESATPLRKEDLIERIWGQPYDPRMDARFYKLMERLRNATSLQIVTFNRTYSYAPGKKAS